MQNLKVLFIFNYSTFNEYNDMENFKLLTKIQNLCINYFLGISYLFYKFIYLNIFIFARYSYRLGKFKMLYFIRSLSTQKNKSSEYVFWLSGDPVLA